MIISFFRSDKDTDAIRKDPTWEDLVKEFQEARPRDIPKDQLPMWSAAAFTDDRRLRANVEQVSLLVYDVDEAPVPTLDVIERTFVGVAHFVHSSSSALSDSLRWRLIIKLSRPVTPDEYAVLWRTIAERLPFKVGAASKDCSRAWYAPREGADGTYITGGAL